jgi:hypothetical protein
MATKEDILEQLVEEYLLHEGYFVRHNLKFKPRTDHPDFNARQDSNHSDIDVIGYHPTRTGPDKIVVVSCKSWQDGFNPAQRLRGINESMILNGREAWKGFRELVVPKWSEAFITAVEESTGRRDFTYMLAVTKVIGDRTVWESNSGFIESLAGNPIKIIDLREMLVAIAPRLGTTLAGTEVGRMLQLFTATGIDITART